MKITIGEWRTRDGRKAIVAAENKQADADDQFIGWIGGIGMSWYDDGIHQSNKLESGRDLIAPWTDPVPWDWSTTPPWINWIAMDSNGSWSMYNNEPTCGISAWNTSEFYHRIPSSHHPKWSGDWKLSKTMRPGYKEVK